MYPTTRAGASAPLPPTPAPSAAVEHQAQAGIEPAEQSPLQWFAVVFADELEEHGRGIVRFNPRTPNPHFRHYAVVQRATGQDDTVARLLAEVRKDYPQAQEEDAQRAVWIVREPRQPSA